MTSEKTRKWPPRRWSRIVLAATLTGCVAYPAWMLLAEPAGFPIHESTTGFVTPLREDGTVDTYAAYKASQGWPTKPSPHAWNKLLNTDGRQTLHFRHPMLEPDWESTDYRRYQRSQQVPFNDNDDPEYAALVDANERWYQSLLSTEPAEESEYWANHNDSPTLGELVCMRAMLQTGRGNTAEAIKSLRFLLRVGAKSRRWASDVIGATNGSTKRATCQQVVQRLLLSRATKESDVEAFAFELTEPVPYHEILADIIDKAERFHELRSLASPVWINTDVDNQSKYERYSERGLQANWTLHRIDWYRFAATYHAYVDGLIEQIRIANDGARIDALRKYRRETSQKFSESLPDPANWPDVITSDVTKLAEQQIPMAFAMLMLQHRLSWEPLQRRLTLLTIYLNRFRLKHGRFPATLDEMRPSVPTEHHFAFENYLTKAEWLYSRTQTGFVIRNEDPVYGANLKWPPEPIVGP